MNNQLKAAAERVARVQSGKFDPCDVYCDPATKFGEHWSSGHRAAASSSYNLDCQELAEAFIAEHPADDDETLTDEWLSSVADKRTQWGGGEPFYFIDKGYYVGTMQIIKRKPEYRKTTLYFIAIDDEEGAFIVSGVATRGKLRQACAFLEITLRN